MFLFKPSNFKDRSKSFFTLGLFFTSSLNLGSLSMDSLRERGLDGSKEPFYKVYQRGHTDKPKTLPTSLNAILAFSLPKVIMWATPFLYLSFKYSKT